MCPVTQKAPGGFMSKILIADDSPEIRKILQKRIEKMGHQAFLAKNGGSTWQMIQNESFDLVILDQEMPDLKGEEVLKNIRSKKRLRNLPVIFLTAHNGIKEKERIFALGANDYIVKQNKNSELEMRIEALLEKEKNTRIEFDTKVREIFSCFIRFYENMSEMYTSFFQAISEFLEMEIVIQSKIVGDTYLIEHCFDQDKILKQRRILSLEQTYCSKVVESIAPVFISDVALSEEWKNHPANLLNKTRSYIGIPIFVQGKLYGTLNAISRFPQEFDDFSIELMQLFAQKIGWKIEQNKMKKEIEETQRELRFMVEGTCSITGESFFQELVQLLALAIQVKFAFVSKIVDEGSKNSIKVSTIAFWRDKELGKNFEYHLSGSPCEGLLGGSISFYPKDLKTHFPDNPVLMDLKAECYLGIPFFDSSGKVIGTLVVMDSKPMENKNRKMSLMKVFAARAGAELERQDNENKLIEARSLSSMSRMTSSIAHEMRSPLTAADMDLAEAEESLQEGHIKNIISFSRKHLKETLLIIRSMMKVYRSNSALKKTWVDINEELANSVLLFGRKSQGIEIIYNFAGKARILTDANLGRIFVNIIGNALDALQNKGRLIITTRLVNDNYLVELEDNGPGIPKNILEKIFESSFTTKNTGEGTGLGLWIVKQEVERLKGRVLVESEEGHFTKFKVTIPSNLEELNVA